MPRGCVCVCVKDQAERWLKLTSTLRQADGKVVLFKVESDWERRHSKGVIM